MALSETSNTPEEARVRVTVKRREYRELGMPFAREEIEWEFRRGFKFTRIHFTPQYWFLCHMGSH